MAKTPLAKKKSERNEIKLTPRRSEKAKSHSSASSGSKMSDSESSVSSLMERKKEVNEKCVKELTVGSREVRKSEKHIVGIGKRYEPWLEKSLKKVKGPGSGSAETSGGGGCLKRQKLANERESRCTEEVPPLRFGTKQLEGKHPQLKSCSSLSEAKRKREQHCDELSKTPEGERDEVVKKSKTGLTSIDHSHYLKPGSEGKQLLGCKEGIVPHSPSMSTACVNTRTDEKFASIKHNVNGNALRKPESSIFESEERRKLCDSQKSLHLLLKPEILKLCGILQLSDGVRDMVEKLLEYVMNNHHVNREPETELQAFQISLCWAAASFLKQKVDHKESLLLAKQHLDFSCIKEDVEYAYQMVRCLKKTFQYRMRIFMAAKSPKSAELSSKDALEYHSHAKSLQSTNSTLRKVESEVEDLPMNPEYLARKDVSKSIKEIHKKFKRKMTKLIEKQRKEKHKVWKSYEEKKGRLEREQKTESAVIRTCFQSNTSMRTDKLKMLEKQIDKHKEHMGMRLERLEELQLEARIKLNEKEKLWVEKVQSWARVELLDRSPPNGFEPSEQVSFNKDPEDFVSLRDHGLDKIVHHMKGGVIGLSGTPGNAQDEDCAKELITDGGTSENEDVLLDVPEIVCSTDGSQKVVTSNLAPFEESIHNAGALSISDAEVRLEVLKSVSSTDGSQGPRSLNLSSVEENPDGVTLIVTDTEAPLGLYETVSLSHGLHNVAAVSPPSAEEQIHVVTVTTQDKAVVSGGLELVCSDDGLRDLVSVDRPSSEEQVPEKASEHDTVGSSNCLYNIESVRATSSEEQTHVTTVTTPAKVVESVVLETTSPNGGLGNLVSVDPPSSEQQILEKATDHETDNLSYGMHNVAFVNPTSSTEQSHVVRVTINEKVADLGVLQTVCSDDVMGILVSVDPPSSEEQILENATEHETLSSSHGLHNLESVNPPSSEERRDIATATIPAKCVEAGVFDTVSSNGGLGNLVSVDSSSSEEQIPEKSTEKENSELHVIESGSETGVNQKNGVDNAVYGNSFGEIPLVNSPTVQPVTTLVHGGSMTPDQAHEDIGTVLANLTAVQSRDSQPSKMQSTNQPVENPVSPSVSTAADYDVVGNEIVAQVPLLPSSNTPDHSSPELSSAGGIGIDRAFNQVAQALIQSVENLPDLLDQTVLRPMSCFSLHQSVYTPTSGFGLLSSDTRSISVTNAFNTRPQSAYTPTSGFGLLSSDIRSACVTNAPHGVSQMPLPFYLDPLHIELKKLNREAEQNHKSHEDTKLRLKSDCDKEIEEAAAEIRRKYEIRFQETEAEFHLKKKELDLNRNKVFMNTMLAFTFSKYTDLNRASSASGVQQDGNSIFVQQLDQLFMQQTSQRHPVVSSSSLGNSPAPSLQTSSAPLPSLQTVPPAPATNTRCTAPPMQTPFEPATNPHCASPTMQPQFAPTTNPHCTAPPMQTVPLSTAPFPSNLARPPHISSFSCSTEISRGGGEIRAPAPHLQLFRSASSVPNRQSHSDSPTTSPSLPHIPSLLPHIPRLPGLTQHFFPYHRAHHPENAGGFPVLLSADALRLVMDSRYGANPPGSLPSLPNLGSNLDRLHISDPAVMGGSCVNPAHTGESTDVVCVSDDD